MKIIAITSPSFFEGEASFLNSLPHNGIDLIHLRKPDATYDDCARLIERLDDDTRCRTVIHQYFEQARQYCLHGIHLNRRCPDVPDDYPRLSPEGNLNGNANWQGSVSCSCHSLDEVVEKKPLCDYVFLSPIFDSISKRGYRSAFTPKMLLRAAATGIIDEKVYALGGVTPARFSLLEAWHFGGAAMLGFVNAFCLNRSLSETRNSQVECRR